MDTAQFATWYARRGIHVFPCHSIEDGVCTCGNPSCKSPGKHPVAQLAPHGVTDATNDRSTITQWWAMFPDANIGVATGERSNLVVVDIDPDHGGEDSWQNLEARYESVEHTWWAETGSGGYHIYFRADGLGIRNSASLIGPGIDVRGEGGYVIAPPSLHASGRIYAWSDTLGPGTMPEPGTMPDWLLSRIAGSKRLTASRDANPIPEKIAEGARNQWMASIAGTMRRRGMSRQAIEAALQMENKVRCVPPLDHEEISRIAISINRYPAVVEGVSFARAAAS